MAARFRPTCSGRLAVGHVVSTWTHSCIITNEDWRLAVSLAVPDEFASLQQLLSNEGRKLAVSETKKIEDTCKMKKCFQGVKLVLLTCAISLMLARSTTGERFEEGQPCLRTNQCVRGLCCARWSHTRGKRSIMNSLFDSGSCRPLRVLSQTCRDWHERSEHSRRDGLHDYCPCSSGLRCRGEEVIEIEGTVIHINPICQPAN